MSISRGDFLKQLGKSLPGMVLGGGLAVAQKVLGKVSAVSSPAEMPATVTSNVAEKKPESAPPAEPESIYSGPTTGNRLALTFDDGPRPGVTDRILDELKQRKLRATFFMIGQNIATAPDLARRVLAEGHEIGNHTYTHPHLGKLPAAQADVEVQKTQNILREVLDYRPAFFRAPYGELRQDQTGMIARRGMRIAFWSVDPQDWSKPGGDKISSTILAEAKAGSIILCHDMPQTAECIGEVLGGLLTSGFSPVTLSELLG